MEKVFCVWCEEDTEYDQGREIWQSKIDGSYGHKYCIDKYDKSLKEKAVKEDSYKVPFCAKCESELIYSQSVRKEIGFRISKFGETLTFPIDLYRYSGDLEERLYCERCKSYYEAFRDDKNRLIKGKLLN